MKLDWEEERGRRRRGKNKEEEEEEEEEETKKKVQFERGLTNDNAKMQTLQSRIERYMKDYTGTFQRKNISDFQNVNIFEIPEMIRII